jgi:hypothetical protein
MAGRLPCAETKQAARRDYYKALARPASQGGIVNHNIVGELHIKTAPYAPLGALWNKVAALLVRESGF